MVEPVEQVGDVFTVEVGTRESQQVAQILLGVPRGQDR
jgi:hypothetical protein